jgi:hypothetical protein
MPKIEHRCDCGWRASEFRLYRKCPKCQAMPRYEHAEFGRQSLEWTAAGNLLIIDRARNCEVTIQRADLLDVVLFIDRIFGD